MRYVARIRSVACSLVETNEVRLNAYCAEELGVKSISLVVVLSERRTHSIAINPSPMPSTERVPETWAFARLFTVTMTVEPPDEGTVRDGLSKEISNTPEEPHTGSTV